jgi:hypothetical protein
MKKIILSIIMVFSLYGEEYNILMSGPVQSDNSMQNVNKAIFKGLQNQYTKIKRLLIRNSIDSVVEVPYFFRNRNEAQSKAHKIINNLMQDIYNIEKDEVDTKAKKEDDEMSLDGNLDISNLQVSEFENISDKESDKGNLNQLGEDTILKLGSSFLNKNIEWVGDAKFHTFANSDLVKLDALYGMIFVPTVRGRTHTTAIRLYLIDVNEDGKSVTVMRKLVKEFPWHKNPRYISAVTGRLLKEILSLGTKQKIE